MALASVAKSIALSFLAVFGVRTEEQPHYAVIDKLGDVEIRRYGPRFAAETTIETADETAGRSEAFQLLAGYIFGNNTDKRKIAMTAPVATEKGREIAMTAPVETRSGGPDMLTMRFFLPSDVTAANAPVPNDPRVKLVELPGETLAVLRFSGSWNEDAMRRRQEALIAALQGSRWQPDGQPFSLFYDPPFTLPFLRRNEAAVRARAK